MSTKRREPKILCHGKQFHKKIQQEWRQKAAGVVKTEESVTKTSGRKGRMDIFVKSDEAGLVAVAEIKASDWDGMTANAIHRNVTRQANQIWDYVESQLEAGSNVSPGVIFPRRPRKPGRLNLIEKLFEDKGIAVVWEDESISERRARS